MLLPSWRTNKPRKRQYNIVYTVSYHNMECCICFESDTPIAYDCQQCHDGNICETCFDKLESNTCPLCRTLIIKVAPPDVLLEPPRRSHCTIQYKKCCLSTGYTILFGILFQYIFGLYVYNVIINICIMIGVGILFMGCIHIYLIFQFDDPIYFPYICCNVDD